MKMQLEWIEVRGFRAFGLVPQKIEVSPTLTIVRAENSQGKTSLSEAIEFLLTGTTSRRHLHNGAKAEFDGCLRNAHLAANEDVWVQAQFKLKDGTITVVKRQLTHDYDGATECQSELSRDGVSINTIEEVGLNLSGHNLAAPVLQQHVLGFVAAAAPQERANYFKALLDLTDLELVRSKLADHLANLGFAPTAFITSLAELSQNPTYSKHVKLVLKCTAYEELEKQLVALGNEALKETGHKTAYKTLAEVVENLDKIVQARVAKIISTSEITLEEIADIVLASVEETTSDYLVQSAKIDQEVARLVPIFESMLKLPALAHAEHEGEPTDCPVCGSKAVITTARIAELRKQLTDNKTFNETATATETALNKISSTITTARTNLMRTTPACSSWDDEQKAAFRAKAVALGIPEELIDQVLNSVYEIGAELDKIYKNGEVVRLKLSEIIQSVRQRAPITKAQLKTVQTELDAFEKQYVAVKATIDTHLVSQEQLQESVKKRAEEQSGTKVWSEVLALCKQPDEILEDIKNGRAAKRVKQRYEKACEEIDKAVTTVFNAKFGSMSDEIVEWWDTLRPDELTSFEGVKMRGTGRRWYDLKAKLKPAAGTSGVTKDAVSIFSDSQLNALGLSSFLARCSIQSSPFLVLDDPIPSGDEDHRLTFAMNTLAKILDGGVQAVVTVFDTTMAQQMDDLHMHRDIKYYEIVLNDRTNGCEIIAVSDEYYKRMATAKSLMLNPHTDARRTAGQSLRAATERVAKQIIVAAKRNAGDTSSIADYDGKTIGDLTPIVSPYAANAQETGLWSVLARELNRSDHDTNPPSCGALKQCYDCLRQIAALHPETRSIRR